VLEIAKILISLGFLIWASIEDYRTREVTNLIWVIFIPIALALTGFEILTSNIQYTLILRLFVVVGISAVIFIAVFYFGLFGGADVKALIALSLMLPWQPGLAKPLLDSLLPLFPLSIFINSMFLALFILPYALLRNLFWKVRTKQSLFEGLESETLFRKACSLILCYKVKSSKMKSYDSLAEKFSVSDEGMMRKKLVFSTRVEDMEPPSTDSKNLPQHVFVNIAMPTIVFITAGLVVSLLIGDIVFWLMIRLMFGYG